MISNGHPIEFITAPEEGIRLGGRTYRNGETVPERYRKRLEEPSRPRDPAQGHSDLAPNLGRSIIPHTITFSGQITTLSRAYRNPDEAIQHSVENANMMLLDPTIFGPLSARQKMVSLLNWHIEPEDSDDPGLAAVAERLTAVVNRTPRFTEYRRSLLNAVWTGRHANQHKYARWIDSRGRRSTVIKDWLPVDGDKLVFRFDDGTGEFDHEQIGVRVSPAHIHDDVFAGKWQVEYYAHGSAIFWEKWEREQVCLHKHFIQDAPFEEPNRAGSVHGLGLRNYLYWVWYQKQETLAKLMELVERSALGFTIYYYEDGNPTARDEMRKVAQEQAHTNVILLPRSATHDANGVEQIPPNVQGIESLRTMIDGYFGDQITRMILGQTLSTKAEATGLGSGLADLHLDSLKQIVRYDAVNLEETLTKELLKPLIRFNYPKYSNHDFWVRIATEAAIPKEELEAIQMAYELGAKIKVSDIFDRIGLAVPGDDEEFLLNPQIKLGQQQVEMQDMQMAMAQQQAAMGGGMPQESPPEEEPQQQAKDDGVSAVFGPILHRKERYAEEQGELFENPPREPWKLKSQDVLEKMGNRAPADEVRSMLTKGGVKDEELQWTGLDEHLKPGSTVNKDDLLGKSFKVGEVVKGWRPLKTSHTEEDMGDGLGQIDVLSEDSFGDDTKFHEWQLPGGENYREVLLTHEGHDAKRLSELQSEINASMGHIDKRENIPALVSEYDQLVKQKSDDYTSSHWDEPNVLAHLRMNDRVDHEGKKTLFLEEIQSDWHQTGRKEGYRASPARELEMKNRLVEIEKQKKELASDRLPDNRMRDEEKWHELSRESHELTDEYNQTVNDAIPDAPFKKTWPALAMKRAIEEAVANGHDQIAWTTGDHQNDRYDLSKQVKRINWTPGGGLGKKVFVDHNGGVMSFEVSRSGKIANADDNATAAGLGGRLLSDVVGQDIAQAIMDGERGDLAGDDLKVGGDGMRSFYDKMLPNIANKLIKKHGGRVTTTKIRAPKEKVEDLGEGLFDRADVGKGGDVDHTVWSFDITPSMRKAVQQQGQHLFARDDEPDRYAENFISDNQPWAKDDLVNAPAGTSMPAKPVESMGSVEIPDKGVGLSEGGYKPPQLETLPPEPPKSFLERTDAAAQTKLGEWDGKITDAAAGVYNDLLVPVGNKIKEAFRPKEQPDSTPAKIPPIADYQPVIDAEPSDSPASPDEMQFVEPEKKWWGEGDRPTAEHFDGLPKGSKVDGWASEVVPDVGTFWTKDGEYRTGDEMAASDDIDHSNHFNPHEQVNEIAGMFGMRFGDPSSPEAEKFLRTISQKTGYTPTDTEDALQHLEGQQKQLNTAVEMARGLGLNPQSTNLLDNAKAARSHIMKSALANGYRPESNDPQQNLAGAMAHMQTQGGQLGQGGLFDKLEQVAGGKLNLFLLAGSLLAFSWMSGMFDRR